MDYCICKILVKTRKRRRSYRQQSNVSSTIINKSQESTDLVTNYLPMKGIPHELRKIIQSNKTKHKMSNKTQTTCSRARARLSHLTNLGNPCATAIQIDRSDSFTTQPLLLREGLELEDQIFLESPNANSTCDSSNLLNVNPGLISHFSSPANYRNLDSDHINLPITEQCMSLDVSCKNLNCSGRHLERESNNITTDQLDMIHNHSLDSQQEDSEFHLCTRDVCPCVCELQINSHSSFERKKSLTSNYLINYDKPPSLRSRSSLKLGQKKRCPSTIKEESGMDFSNSADTSFQLSSARTSESKRLKKSYTEANIECGECEEWTVPPLDEPCHRRRSIAEGIVTGREKYSNICL